MNKQPSKMTFLIGGLLPVIAFTLVEQFYGAIGGAIAGIVFGLGEIGWEYRRMGKVQNITWVSNGLVLVFGLLSLWEDNGVFFKLQPAALLLLFAFLLFGSSLMKKPFLSAMARKQNPHLPVEALAFIDKLNFRLGIFFLFLTALSVYAAFYWTTVAWAFLKGIGLPILLGAYILAEVAWMRIFRRSIPKGGESE